MDRQILFTNQTKVKEIEEREYFIANNTFDFYDLGDVKQLLKQTTLLAGMKIVTQIARRIGAFNFY